MALSVPWRSRSATASWCSCLLLLSQPAVVKKWRGAGVSLMLPGPVALLETGRVRHKTFCHDLLQGEEWEVT